MIIFKMVIFIKITLNVKFNVFVEESSPRQLAPVYEKYIW